MHQHGVFVSYDYLIFKQVTSFLKKVCSTQLAVGSYYIPANYLCKLLTIK